MSGGGTAIDDALDDLAWLNMVNDESVIVPTEDALRIGNALEHAAAIRAPDIPGVNVPTADEQLHDMRERQRRLAVLATARELYPHFLSRREVVNAPGAAIAAAESWIRVSKEYLGD